VSVATLQTLDAQGIAAAMEHFLDQGVDGVVIIAERQVREDLEAWAAQVPVVAIAAEQPPGPGYLTTSVDQVLGARIATRHLLELGHREIVHLAGPQDWLDGHARVIGWRRELEQAGIVAGDPIQGDWSADTGYEVGRRLVHDGVPTAVFAANDQLALGLLRAFAEGGVSVPRDVSVVGFDDVMGAAHFIPPLTTVQQGFEALGRQCLDMLLGAIEGREIDHTPIAPRLVVRASTGPPRG